MPQKIFTATPTGALDYVNRQWTDFTGLSFGQIRDRDWTHLLHPEDIEQTLKVWKASIETGAPLRCVHRLRRSDGTYRWHLSRAHAMRDAAGRIVMWIGSNTDIHEEKEIEAQLRRANADLEQFAYSASHDLQEPIRNVSVYSELLAQRYNHVLDEKGRQCLQFIRGGAQRMQILVKDLLSYAKSASMEEERIEEVDAAGALDQALSNLSEAIRETQADVSYNGLPVLRVPEVQLVQLFQNLIGNAIKYRNDEEPPRVAVAAQRQGVYWQISVKDNGIGIGPEYRDKVFGIFKRLHNQARYSGTGIGLAICKRIVERNGGRIWVESEGLGKGSTFLFTLPCA
jgi:PAS domain S-box-containing protein